MPNLKEHQLIERIAKNWGDQDEQLLIGIGDDGAVFKSPGAKLCWVQDMMLEGTHFLSNEMSAFDLGHKSLAVNLSDMAAMGAKPNYFQVSLGLTKSQDQDWLDSFYEGMLQLAREFEIKLIGGDLSQSNNQLFIDISVLGSVETPITRTSPQGGWKTDDRLWICGPIGCAKAGREVISAQDPNFSFLKSTYQRPTPQLKTSTKLLKLANQISMIDISDGLVSESEHLLGEQKQGGLIIFEDKLPIHRELLDWARLNGQKAVDYALWGGEDYALLVITPKDIDLPPEFIEIGCYSTKVQGVNLQNKNNELCPISSDKGWNAFS